MKNVLRVFWRDVRRLFKAPAALVVVLVLITLPSLYTWFNVVGFWNPYDNTGDMRVCVVNQDEGATTEQTGAINVGNMIVEQLETNDQLGWYFTDYDTAMDQVESGEAYAAFVIPDDFSADFTTLLTGDFQQPELAYYVNEKTNAVSPKVTDTGATTLEETINSTFVSTVSGIITGILDKELGEAQANIDASQSNVELQLQKARQSLADGRTSIAQLDAATTDAIDRTAAAQTSLAQAKGTLVILSTQMQQVSALTSAVQGKLIPFTTQMDSALDQGSLKASQASAKTNTAIGAAAGSVVTAQGDVGAAIASGQAAAAQNDAIIVELQTLSATLPAGDEKNALDATIAQLQVQNDNLKASLVLAQKASDDTAATAKSISAASDSVNTAVQGSLAASDEYRNALSTSTIPAIDSGLAQIGGAAGGLSGAISNQTLLIDQSSLVLDQLTSTLQTTDTALGQTDALLASLQTSLDTVETDLVALGTSDAVTSLFGEDGVDPSQIADFMLSPTELETNTIYQLNAYGSSMAPLFTNLTLWIGVFMLMVILKQEVDDEGIEGLTIGQRYWGKWLFLAPIAAFQAIVCCAGNLVIGVQTVNMPLYFLTAIIASLTYLSIQYALSTTLQHIGKGICVILVFIQIPGATGLYPIEMMPTFFQNAYPLFPFTYGINAMRETIAGFYDGQWVRLMLILLLFQGISFFLGLLIRPHLTNLNRLFAKETKESDILNGEDVQAPVRRYRLGQLVKALTKPEEYRTRLHDQAKRFFTLYPKLIRAAWIGGIGVPTLATVLFSVANSEKVVVLTAWLVWLILVMCFLVVVEHMRDSFERQLKLEGMDSDELRALFTERTSLADAPMPAMEGANRVRARIDARRAKKGGDDE